MKKQVLAVAIVGLIFATAQADVGLSAESRLGLNAADHNVKGKGLNSHLDTETKWKLSTWDVLLDYSPFAGHHRLTGDWNYTSKATANAKPNDGTSVGGNDSQASHAATLQGKVEFKKPFLGIGWGNAVARDKGLGFTSDLGLMFQGAPRTPLTSSACVGAPATCTQLQSDLPEESLRLSDVLKDLRAYPILRIGISYRF